MTISKNILIAGVARSGKSTLSMRLAKKLQYNHFPVDYIASSLNNSFPQCHINNRVVIDEGSINLSLFLGNVMQHMNKIEEKFIIDSAHIMPIDIMSYIESEKWNVIFMGYPNISVEEKLMNVRKYDLEKEWTKNFPDESLSNILERLIQLSREIQIQCETLNIPFIDTSVDFTETLNQEYQKIILNK